MKIYTKEYGWIHAHFDQWLRWILICSWLGHSAFTKLLPEGHSFRGYYHTGVFGKRGWCNSDNCSKCLVCGIESHD